MKFIAVYLIRFREVELYDNLSADKFPFFFQI